MSIAPLVAQHVTEVVHGNWTDIFLGDVIADITYEEAVTRPPGITNSIAMLLYHIGFYNDVVRMRIEGEKPAVGADNGFAIEINNDTDWQRLKANALASFTKLADAAKGLSDEELLRQPAEGSTFYKNLHGVAEHGHYPMGEIMLLKKIIRHSNNKIVMG